MPELILMQGEVHESASGEAHSSDWLDGELRIPEQSLRTLLGQIPDAILCFDREWRITYANAEAIRVSRLLPEHFHRKTHWELYPETVGTEIERIYRAVMETRVPAQTEYFYEPFDVSLDIRVYPTDEGLALYYRDITEKQTRESALVEQQELLAVVQETALAATWDFEIATGKLTFGPGSHPLFGRPLKEISTLEALERIVAPGDVERVKQSVREALQGSAMVVVEFQVMVPDGTLLWIESRGRAIFDGAKDSATPTHLRGMVIDVTERKRNEVALLQRQRETERQRAELETVYQTAPVGLALFDPANFRYLRLNERQAEMLGLPSEQVVGRTYAEIAPIAGLREMFQLAAAGHAVKNQLVEGELPTRPGEHRIWNVSHSPVYGEDGTIQAITAAWLEITHLKKAEAALVQSEKLAAVGRLASSISHEINNPLEAITNLLYLIALSEDLPQDLKIYIHMAQSELSRVSQIATQTLRFHRQAVRPTWVTAGELIDAVLNLYQGRLANSGIKVQAAYSTQTRVLCFENDIRQVLNNLIANAIDAMRNGGRLVVRAHDAVEYGSGRMGVRLTIADNGHGMPPEVKARLFEPFYTTKDLNGTGLGLWISEGIVQRHQGRLSVRSTQHPVHHGTVFSLFLPCAETPSPEGLSV
jgi:PAS domain S-box-containing protein